MPSYRTRSFAHPCVSHICPRIPTPLSVLPPPYVSYCVTLSPFHILLLASCETPSKVGQSFSMEPLGTTKPPSCIHPPHIPSPLKTLRISAVPPPAVPQLPTVSIYISSPTSFPPLPALLLTRASPTPRLLSAVIASP